MRCPMVQVIFLSFLSLFNINPAVSSDQCKDILVNAVFNTLSVNKDNYYRTTLLSALDEKSEEDEKHNASLGVDIEGIPFYLSYSDARHLKSEISKYYNLNAIAHEKSSYLLMSGQKNRIDAWQDCISKHGGGVSLRFEPLDGKTGTLVRLFIEYDISVDPLIHSVPIQVIKDSYIDSKLVSIKENANCLKSGKIYRPGDSCPVLLQTQSAWTTLPINLQVKTVGKGAIANIGFSAFLGPRSRIVGSTQAWPLHDVNRTKERMPTIIM